MKPITLTDNEYIVVEYLPDRKCIRHEIRKPIGGQVLRDALNSGTEALKKYGACKWISDDRKNGELSAEDREWGFNDWNRRTIEAGWKYWALVVPEAIIAAGSMIPTINMLYELGLRVMVFSTAEEAFAWLEKMQA
ncbi:hypothetical protein ANRL4_04977 [Anaerolineae bacterium]|nr:hypothetical protein ANRL4_04977 [Anaerolineae bacterium]